MKLAKNSALLILFVFKNKFYFFQTTISETMTCSACIENPAQFLATSCRRLVKFPEQLRQKIYDDAFLGIPLLPHVNSFSLPFSSLFQMLCYITYGKTI